MGGCGSRYCVVVVYGDHMSDWDLPAETVGDVVMLSRRLIPTRMEFAMLNFSFEDHTVL